MGASPTQPQGALPDGKIRSPLGATPRQSLAGFLEARIDLEDAALRDGFERLLLQLGPLLADPARLEAALELLDRADEAIGILDAQAQWAEAFLPTAEEDPS